MTGPGPIRTHNFYIEPTNHLSAGGGTQKLENFGATSSCLPGNSSNYCTYIPFCGASSSSCVQEPERAWLPAQQGNDLLDAIFQCKLGGYQYEGVGVRTGAVLTAPSLSTGAANEPALQGVWYNGMFGRGGTTYRPASFTTPTFNLPGFHILHGWCDSIYHPPHWYQISQDWFPKQTYGCYLAQFMGFSSTFFWYELQNLFNEFSHWGCPLTRLKGDAAGTIEALSYDIHFDHREGIGIELGVGHWCDTDYGNLPKPFVFDCFWPGNIYEDRMERPYRNKITTNNQGLLFYHDNKSYFQQRQKWKSRRPVPLSRIKSELSFRELSSLTYSPQVWGNTFGAPNFLTELWNKEDDHAHGHAGLAIEIAPSKMSYGQVIYARALGGSLTCCPGNAKQGNPNIHFRIIADHGVPHVDPVTSSYAFSPNPSSSSYAYGKACYKNIHGDLISTLTTEPGFGERWPSFWAKVDCCEPSESFASPTPIPSPSACSYNSSLSNIVYVTGSNPGLSLKSWNLAISTFSVDKIPPSTHWSSVPDPNLTETTFLHGLENLPITHLDQMNYMSIPIWGDGKFIYTARQKNSEALPGAVEKGLTTWVANGCGGLIKCGEALGGDTCTDIWGDGNFVYTLNSWNWLWYDGEKIWEYGPGGYNLIAQPPTHGVHIAIGLHSYAISNEGQPTHKDWHFPWSPHNTFMTAWGMAHSLRDPMRPNRIWGDGSFVYMSDMCMGTPDGPHQSCPRVGGLHTYSVDGLGNLTHVTVKSLAHFAHGIWGDGNFIYVATAMGTGYPITYSGGLYVFSVDSSGNLTQLDFNSVEPCFDVWGDGDFIYTVGYGGLINSYSVDSSGILTHIDSKSTGIVRVGYQDTGVRIHGDGNLIYATYRTAGLHVYGCIKTGPNAGHLVHLDDAFTPHPYYGTAFGVFAYPAGGNP
jgi:hypothetical protein